VSAAELQDEDDVQAIVHQKKPPRPRAILPQGLGQGEDRPPAESGAPEVESDPMPPHLQGTPGLGEEARPAEDGIVGNEVETRDHSKLMVVEMA
jgi:hypothetical protein